MYSICMHTDLSALSAFIPDTQGPWLSTHDRQLMMTTKVTVIMRMAINIITVVNRKLVILNHNGTSLIRIDEIQDGEDLQVFGHVRGRGHRQHVEH